MQARGSATLAACLAITLALEGCAIVTTLPDGQSSSMSARNNRLREDLAIMPVPLPKELVYKPVGICYYRDEHTPLDRPAIENPFWVKIMPSAGRRVFVSAADGAHVLTAILEPRGSIHSFNIHDDDGVGYTQRNFQAGMQEKVAKAEEEKHIGQADPHALNEIGTVIPDFSLNPHRPGDDAAIVMQEDGTPWATYKYRGLATLDGTTAAVFDLKRVFPSSPELGPVLVGFDVVDLDTMLPVEFVLDAGLEVHLYRAGCVKS